MGWSEWSKNGRKEERQEVGESWLGDIFRKKVNKEKRAIIGGISVTVNTVRIANKYSYKIYY
jgi:hypothetical protein